MQELPLSISSLIEFLHQAKWPRFSERQPTFFSIAGIGHKELPLSNTYAFFFRSDAAHGLGSLFTLALLDIVSLREKSFDLPDLECPIRVSREHPVRNRQRLDLLIHNGSSETSVQDATLAILIENKVHHWLHNDLDNYWESIQGPKQKIGIVLGIRREQAEAPWLFISHQELARAIEARLGPVISHVSPRYLPVLLHLLEHLKQMTGFNNDNFAQAFSFAQRHRAYLAQAQQLMGQITAQGLADSIVEAWGPEYELQGWFDDRVDIKHIHRGDMRYIVFFAHVLDLNKTPGFAITLYAGWASKQQVGQWRQYFEKQPAAIEAGLAPLPWFPRSYNELVIGKKYSFTGTTLDDFQTQVREALNRDWRPLEASWLNMQAPPEDIVV